MSRVQIRPLPRPTFAVLVDPDVLSATVTSGSGVNDAAIEVRFTNGGAVNTGLRPGLRYTAGTLTDLNGNLMASVDNVASLDNVSPALIESLGIGGSFTDIALRFSEAISAARVG